MSDFTHFIEQGRAKMVEVGEKDVSRRVAVAGGRVLVNEEETRFLEPNRVDEYEKARKFERK